MRILLSILIVFTLFNCVPPTQTGENAQVFVSGNFDKNIHKKIAVFPFIQEGREGLDNSTSDKFSMHLMEMGYTVIDRSQINFVLNEAKLDMSGLVKSGNYTEVGSLLKVDVIVNGTISSYWREGQSVERKGKTFTRPAGWVLTGETVKFISVETGEVLITANVNARDSFGSMIKEIALKIQSSTK